MKKAYLISKEYKAYLEAFGISSDELLDVVGIPKIMTNRGVYISKQQYIHLMKILERESTDNKILMYSDISKVTSFSPPIFAGLCAINGLECFKRISEYKKLIGPFTLKVHEEENDVVLEFTFDDEGKTKLPKFTQITENLIMVNLLRQGTGKKIKPVKIKASYEYPKKIKDYLGITPELSNQSKIYFSKEDLQVYFRTENNTMWDYLEPEFKKRMEEMQIDDSVSAKVRILLTKLIPAGNANIAQVSKEMAISPRSLQRKLSEENTTFVKQLNHTRELMAKNYLINDSVTTDEVAYLVGYSDVYVFMRAFRQWTGLTVKQFRTEHA